MSDADIQQADQLQGAKHPRHTHKLFGHKMKHNQIF